MRVRGPCGVVGCPNNGTHTFPRNETIRLKWIQAMKLDCQRKVGWTIRKYSSICSEHFKPSDFIIPFTLSSGMPKPRRLMNNAIPSIFPWNYINEGETSSAIDAAKTVVPSIVPKKVIKTYSRPVLPMAFVEEIPFKEATIYDIDNDPQDDILTDPLLISVSQDDKPSDPKQSTEHKNDDLLSNDDVIDSAFCEVVIELSNTDQYLNTETSSEDHKNQQAIVKSEKFNLTDTFSEVVIELINTDQNLNTETSSEDHKNQQAIVKSEKCVLTDTFSEVVMELGSTDQYLKTETSSEDHENQQAIVKSEKCVLTDTFSEVAIELSNTDQYLNTETSSEDHKNQQAIVKSEKCVLTDTFINAPSSIYNYKRDDEAMHYYTGLDTFVSSCCAS